ncbi:DUF6113 family protein [Actinomadura terrae]|uniref:DUF6113 family protein n=1 Tax=Actinomadura terrae TaxID=604353 RepID=UPI001FA6EC61|nr:DUF6113 family protein [Actinomadura terrae]
MDEDDEARDSAPGQARTAAGATPAEAPPDETAASRAGRGPVETLLSGAAYVVVGVLGGVVGLLGSYSQGWTAGDVPAASIVLIAVVFATVRLSGWGMGGRIGATVPAVVWGIVVFVMSTRRPEGDLVVPATLSGYVYIIGGMLAAVLGVARVPAAGPPGQWLLGRAARNRG